MASVLRYATYWLAYLSAVPGGVSRVVNELTAVRARGIAARLGYAGGRDGGATAANLRRYQDAGLEVSLWWYSVPGHGAAELDLARRVHDETGVARFIINAEIEWTKATNDDARRFVDQARTALPGCWIAHAPFALPISHSNFPYVGFAGLDAVLPQIYPHEFGGPAPGSWFARYRSELATFRAKHPEAASQPWHPIADLYGSQLGPVWKMPQSPPRAWSLADLDVVLAEMADVEWPSFYTLDAAIASGAWADVKAAFAELHEPQYQHPLVPSIFGGELPDAWAPRFDARAVIDEIIVPSDDEIAWFSRHREMEAA